MIRQPLHTLTPVTTTGGLCPLPLALGFALRRRLHRQRRGLHKLLGSLGRPNDFDQDVSIFSAIAVGFDTLEQRQTRFGAQMHFLQALEQLQSSQHSGSTCVEIKRMDFDSGV